MIIGNESLKSRGPTYDMFEREKKWKIHTSTCLRISLSETHYIKTKRGVKSLHKSYGFSSRPVNEKDYCEIYLFRVTVDFNQKENLEELIQRLEKSWEEWGTQNRDTIPVNLCNWWATDVISVKKKKSSPTTLVRSKRKRNWRYGFFYESLILTTIFNKCGERDYK